MPIFKQKHPKPVAQAVCAAGFLRVLAAIVYDVFLLLAVWFLATAIVLPLNAGQAFSGAQFGFPLYLLAVSYTFYAWFWTHGGQTLGLKAWNVRLCNLDGGPVNWRQASIRFAVAILSWACLGLGFIWILSHKDRASWHDLASKTRLLHGSAENKGS